MTEFEFHIFEQPAGEPHDRRSRAERDPVQGDSGPGRLLAARLTAAVVVTYPELHARRAEVRACGHGVSPWAADVRDGTEGSSVLLGPKVTTESSQGDLRPCRIGPVKSRVEPGWADHPMVLLQTSVTPPHPRKRANPLPSNQTAVVNSMLSEHSICSPSRGS